MRSSLRIAIADESSIVVSRLKKFLATNSEILVIAEAKSIVNALLDVERLCPDAIIVDIQLEQSEPKKGIAFLNVLHRTYPNLTIIVFTSLADQRYREQCHMNGADYFFDKAGGAESISETLEEILLLKKSLLRRT